MKRVLWGEFEDQDEKKPTKGNEIILPNKKAEKLKKLKTAVKNVETQMEIIRCKNPLVTQTIEVMNQTEMLQTLIDTYASKSGYNNYLLNPCQMIPQVDFPVENSANLNNENKFSKPFWFIPPIETKFSKGTPKQYPKITAELARSGIRKSVAGLLRIAGFNEASKTSLDVLTESVEEFIRNLLVEARHVQIVESKDKQNVLDILTLEKGYSALTHSSLISIHRYFKNNIIEKNQTEIDEFKDIYHEYDKLMKESQCMQKVNYKEDDYMSFLDFSGIIQNNGQQAEVSGVNILNLIEADGTTTTGTFTDIFEGEVVETTTTDDQVHFAVGGPSSLE